MERQRVVYCDYSHRGYRRQLSPGGVGAQFAADAKAVAARHEQIANDDVGSFLESDIEADLAIGRFEDLPALSFQQFGKGMPKCMIVIDQ